MVQHRDNKSVQTFDTWFNIGS